MGSVPSKQTKKHDNNKQTNTKSESQHPVLVTWCDGYVIIACVDDNRMSMTAWDGIHTFHTKTEPVGSGSSGFGPVGSGSSGFGSVQTKHMDDNSPVVNTLLETKHMDNSKPPTQSNTLSIWPLLQSAFLKEDIEIVTSKPKELSLTIHLPHRDDTLLSNHTKNMVFVLPLTNDTALKSQTLRLLYQTYREELTQRLLQDKFSDIASLRRELYRAKKKNTSLTAKINLMDHSNNPENAFDDPVNYVLHFLMSIDDHTDRLSQVIKSIERAVIDVKVDRDTDLVQDDEVRSFIRSHLGVLNKDQSPQQLDLKEFVKAFSCVIGFTEHLRQYQKDCSKPISVNISNEIVSALGNVDSLNFDVFHFNSVTNGQPLLYMGLYIFEHFRFFSKYQIPLEIFRNFLEKVESEYNHSNPYHNNIHAADVTQTVFALLKMGNLHEKLCDLDIFGLFVASFVHDLGHPGNSNDFECKTQTQRAMLYNDQSVLENYHLYKTFTLLQDESCNILQCFPPQKAQIVRSTIIKLVLGTDMKYHFPLISQFKVTILNNFSKGNREHVELLMKLILKSADVSNQVKPVDIAKKWAVRVTEEFFLQGDKEKEAKIPVSVFMDRNRASMEKSQLSFIHYVCKPLYETLANFQESCRIPMDNLFKNEKYWEEEVTRKYPEQSKMISSMSRDHLDST